MFGDDLPKRRPRFRAVTGDVAKWYNAATADAVAATEQLVIYGFHGYIGTAGATDIALFTDEDGANPFGGITLAAAGNFQVVFGKPVVLPRGKDIKVDVTLTTGTLSMDFDCAYHVST